jgi:hypothetical protein
MSFREMYDQDYVIHIKRNREKNDNKLIVNFKKNRHNADREDLSNIIKQIVSQIIEPNGIQIFTDVAAEEISISVNEILTKYKLGEPYKYKYKGLFEGEHDTLFLDGFCDLGSIEEMMKQCMMDGGKDG